MACKNCSTLGLPSQHATWGPSRSSHPNLWTSGSQILSQRPFGQPPTTKTNLLLPKGARSLEGMRKLVPNFAYSWSITILPGAWAKLMATPVSVS